ncbi:hypothetical protein [Spiroplasma endosymbiont of Labia minor]|uniref:hypothetical protein n=1 Tax=Spiroplasma endosymbiont of Labia minor TaxID=3066305 RepID=UPI0030D0B443
MYSIQLVQKLNLTLLEAMKIDFIAITILEKATNKQISITLDKLLLSMSFIELKCHEYEAQSSCKLKFYQYKNKIVPFDYQYFLAHFNFMNLAFYIDNETKLCRLNSRFGITPLKRELINFNSIYFDELIMMLENNNDLNSYLIENISDKSIKTISHKLSPMKRINFNLDDNKYLDKNTTFVEEDILWQQAFEAFKKHDLMKENKNSSFSDEDSNQKHGWTWINKW